MAEPIMTVEDRMSSLERRQANTREEVGALVDWATETKTSIALQHTLNDSILANVDKMLDVVEDVQRCVSPVERLAWIAVGCSGLAVVLAVISW